MAKKERPGAVGYSGALSFSLMSGTEASGGRKG